MSQEPLTSAVHVSLPLKTAPPQSEEMSARADWVRKTTAVPVKATRSQEERCIEEPPAENLSRRDGTSRGSLQRGSSDTGDTVQPLLLAAKADARVGPVAKGLVLRAAATAQASRRDALHGAPRSRADLQVPGDLQGTVPRRNDREQTVANGEGVARLGGRLASRRER